MAPWYGRTLLLLLIWLAPAAAAPPCGDFVLAIDVGHSRTRPGATSARGVGEFYFNRDLARQLLAALRSQGWSTTAFLINEAGLDLPLAQRSRLAQQRGADLLLSLHHDSVQPHYLATWEYQGKTAAYSDRCHGYSLFYSDLNPQAAASLVFARQLGQRLRERGFSPSLHHAEAIPGEHRPLVDPAIGLYRFDDLVVLKTATMPAVLLESGIIVNRDEEQRLREPATQQALTAAIIEAVTGVCRQPGFSHRRATR
jgi:N-acetylmuramoyl-L-alanine amidase